MDNQAADYLDRAELEQVAYDMDNQAADYLAEIGDKVLIKVGINAGKNLDVASVFDLGGIEVTDNEFGRAVFYARNEYALI